MTANVGKRLALARWLRLVACAASCTAATGALWLGAAGPAVDLYRALRDGGPGGLDQWTMDRLLAAATTCLLLVAAAVLTCLVWLDVAATAAAVRWPAVAARVHACIPGMVRRLVAVAAGAGMSGPLLLGTAAHADDLPAARADRTPQHSTVSLSGLGFPDLPAALPWAASPTHRHPGRSPDRPAAQLPPAAPQRPEAGLLVSTGDSLWSIAQARQPNAPVSDVATCTLRLYRLNRAAIGPDPDLIFTGTRLVLPKGC